MSFGVAFNLPSTG